MRKYGRNDVDYEEFYSSWMKNLAKTKTMVELKKMSGEADISLKSATKTHLSAIRKTSSMQGNSMARAHARNSVAASGDLLIAVEGAIEIHELFPEKAKK